MKLFDWKARWLVEKPEKLGEELAEEHLGIIRKATISWKEAIRQTDEDYKRLEKEIQEGFEAEARYWENYFA